MDGSAHIVEHHGSLQIQFQNIGLVESAVQKYLSHKRIKIEKYLIGVGRVEEILNVIKQLRVGKIFEEYALQAALAKVFDKSGIIYAKECRLGPGNRVDFLTQSGVAVEVKKGKPNRTRLINQINRYAEYPEVKAVVIVVETSLRIPVTRTANGKPCSVIGLQKLWGIAL